MLALLLVILMVGAGGGAGGGAGSGVGGGDDPDGWDAVFMQVSIFYFIYLSGFSLKRFEHF